jgi:hypothetical protein
VAFSSGWLIDNMNGTAISTCAKTPDGAQDMPLQQPWLSMS